MCQNLWLKITVVSTCITWIYPRWLCSNKIQISSPQQHLIKRHCAESLAILTQRMTPQKGKLEAAECLELFSHMVHSVTRDILQATTWFRSRICILLQGCYSSYIALSSCNHSATSWGSEWNNTAYQWLSRSYVEVFILMMSWWRVVEMNKKILTREDVLVDWRPVQGVPRLSPDDCWARL